MEDETIQKKIAAMLPVLDEKQTRLYLASEAQSIGWGGQSKIAVLSCKSRFVIARGGGAKEFQSPAIQAPSNRIRRKGGGRKKEVDKQSGLAEKLRKQLSHIQLETLNIYCCGRAKVLNIFNLR